MIISSPVEMNLNYHILHQLNKKLLKVFLNIFSDLKILETDVIIW